MGSDSDLEVMQDAFKFLKDNDIPAEIKIVSAHRTPDVMVRYAKECTKERITCDYCRCRRLGPFAWYGCLAHDITCGGRAHTSLKL